MGGRPKQRKELELLYSKIMKLLQNNGLFLILWYGSLLGFIREDNFIDGDDDIDLILPRIQRPLLM